MAVMGSSGTRGGGWCGDWRPVPGWPDWPGYLLLRSSSRRRRSPRTGRPVRTAMRVRRAASSSRPGREQRRPIRFWRSPCRARARGPSRRGQGSGLCAVDDAGSVLFALPLPFRRLSRLKARPGDRPPESSWRTGRVAMAHVTGRTIQLPRPADVGVDHRLRAPCERHSHQSMQQRRPQSDIDLVFDVGPAFI